jgi:hypothetical protein
MLDLLDVQYLVIDASLRPTGRMSVTLTDGFNEVYRDDHVVSMSMATTSPCLDCPRGAKSRVRGALPLIVDGEIDPYQTALVEEAVPTVVQRLIQRADRADVRYYAPEDGHH